MPIGRLFRSLKKKRGRAVGESPFGRYVTWEQYNAMIAAMQSDGIDVLWSKYGLLYINPEEVDTLPLIDVLTRKITSAFRQRDGSGILYAGIHFCVCGAASSPEDYILPNGLFTNLLCIHYVAFHRKEIPKEQLEAIAAFEYGEAEPTQEELQYPRTIRSSR